MRAVVVYESMYGNTHQVADAIGAGLKSVYEVGVLPVADAGSEVLADADLVVVGGPTHAHGMSRESTRRAAGDAAGKPGSDLTLESEAVHQGLREWFASLGQLPAKAAAFDTRIHGPALLTGRASKGIAHLLRQHGCEVVTEPESFLVSRDNQLDAGETERARDWAAKLAADVAAG